MICRHNSRLFDHSRSCRAILKTTTTMAMVMNLKPQTRITRMSTIKATMTSRNIRIMASSRKTTDTSSEGMEMAVTMTNREFGLHQSANVLLTSGRGYYNADATNHYQQDGGYYEGHQQGYQDEYYNDQYYDQGTPAAGQQPHYGQGGYGSVLLSFFSLFDLFLQSAEPSQSAGVTTQKKTRRPSATSP